MRLGILASAFDPVCHPGHLWAMKQAHDAGACDGIMAALHVNPAIERHEKRTPALSVDERRMILKAIRYVSHVETYTTEGELVELMKATQPVVRIIGEDHVGQFCTGDDMDPPIPIFWAKRRPDWSGTEFSRRIAEAYLRKPEKWEVPCGT